MIKIFVLFIIGYLSMIISFGQSTIKGKIIDPTDNEPIVGSVIRLKDAITVTVSELDGSFSLKTTETGDRKIVITMIGYAIKEVEVHLNSDIVDIGIINLETEAIGLKEVTIVASIATERQTPVHPGGLQCATSARR